MKHEEPVPAGVVVGLLLFAGVLLTFSAAFYAEFLGFDDPQVVVDNPHVHGLSWENLKWMFTEHLNGHYHPLTWLSFAVESELWGLRAQWCHATNVVLHGINAVLVFVLAGRVLTLAGLKGGEGKVRTVATLAAVLWAMHPLRVESVAWVTERRDVLSTMWLLAAMLAYLRWAGGGADQGRGTKPAWKWYIACLAFLTLSLLSKAWGMSFFVLALIVDWCVLRRFGWRALADKVPMLALGLGAAVMAGAAQRDAEAMKTLAEWGVADRAVQGVYGLWFYVQKTLWPTRLAALYQLPPRVEVFAARFVVAYVGVGAMLAGVGWAAVKGRWGVVACAAVYGVLLLPVLGIAQSGDQLVADRYSYVAGIPVALLLAAGVGLLETRLKDGGKKLVAVLAGAWCLVLAGLTWVQTDVWHDTNTMWRHAAAVAPGSRVYGYIGESLVREGKVDEALRWYKEAVELDPSNGRAWFTLGNTLASKGMYVEAAAALARSAETQKQAYMAYVNLGTLYVNKLNKPVEAERAFRAAVEDCEKRRRRIGEGPESALPYVTLGSFLVATGRVDEGRAWLEKALAYPETHGSAMKELEALKK